MTVLYPWRNAYTEERFRLDVAEWAVRTAASDNHEKSTAYYIQAIGLSRKMVDAYERVGDPDDDLYEDDTEIKKIRDGGHSSIAEAAKNWRRTSALCIAWLADNAIMLADPNDVFPITPLKRQFDTALISNNCVPPEVVLALEAKWRWVDAGGNPRAHGNVRRAFEALVAAQAVENAYLYLSQMRR